MEIVEPFKIENLGKKANAEKIKIGKWYMFESISVCQNFVKYGKVVKIENNEVYAEKVFELPSYRPFVGKKWFDYLPMGIL